MKTPIGIFTAVLFGLCVVTSVHAQPGGPRGRGAAMAGPAGPEWSAAMSKLFGDNPTFTSLMEYQSKGGAKDASMTGKMAFDNGKFRTELDPRV